MKPTVLLDCDGILSGFVDGVLEAWNKIRGTSYSLKDCTQWDFVEQLGFDWSSTDKIVAQPGFCANLKVLDGSQEAVYRLKKSCDVFVVTSPFDASPYWMPERSAWLRELFNIEKSHVIHCYMKRLIRGDFLIDDNPENVTEWAEAWPNGTAILWDAPYNKNAINAGAHRAYCWDYVLELVGA